MYLKLSWSEEIIRHNEEGLKIQTRESEEHIQRVRCFDRREEEKQENIKEMFGGREQDASKNLAL